jgi:hypothetical protein
MQRESKQQPVSIKNTPQACCTCFLWNTYLQSQADLRALLLIHASTAGAVSSAADVCKATIRIKICFNTVLAYLSGTPVLLSIASPSSISSMGSMVRASGDYVTPNEVTSVRLKIIK